MEQITIFFKKEVLESFNDLVFELYSKDYFASLDYAIDYKDKLVSFINNSIASFPHKTTPKKLKHFGEKYIFYNSNQRTTWYVFFKRDLSTSICSACSCTCFVNSRTLRCSEIWTEFLLALTQL